MKSRSRRRLLAIAAFLGAGFALGLIPGFRFTRTVILAPAAPEAPAAPYDWLQNNGDPQHSGNNTLETIIGPSNVASLQFLFQVTLPSPADGAPVYLSSVPTPDGPKDLLFSTTKEGHILALDALTGAIVWSRQYGVGSSVTNSSPAIDPNRQYVYSYGLDGNVHKYQVGDGTEILTGGWPERVTLKGDVEKVPSALSFATAGGVTYLYAVTDGYIGDGGDYQGHLTTINLANGSQRVFNTLCSDQTVHFAKAPGTPDCSSRRSGIWHKNGAIYDAVTNRVYVATGNGQFNANTGGHNWGDSVLALNPDGTGAAGGPVDSYTPTNYASLESGDVDLGSTGPAILPAPAYPGRLAVQSGKDSKLRLIDLTDMSGQGGPGHVGGEIELGSVPQGGGVLTVPAVWTNPADGTTWVFVTNNSGSSGLKLTFPSGVPSLVKQWQQSYAGGSPLIANNVLYFNNGNTIRALDPLTGTLLWSDSTRISGHHWQSPIVANGRLYVTDDGGHLTAWTVPPAGVTPTATLTRTSTRTPTNTRTATRTRTNAPTKTSTKTPTNTRTNTPAAATSTPTATRTNTPAGTTTAPATPTGTPSAAATPTPTPGGVIVPSLSDFRDVRRAADINVGADLGGTGHSAVNFTGSAGAGGDAWLTVYDTTPATPDPGPLFGSVNLSADVLIQTYNNKKGAGLLALFNEGSGKKGLSLIVYDSGNSDSLALAVVDPATGLFTTLATVSLGGNIVENAWYRVTMSVAVNGGNVAVTGKVFRHATPADPGSALGTQVGVNLSFNGPRPAGVDAAGEVGIVASAASTSVNSSVTNFTIGP